MPNTPPFPATPGEIARHLDRPVHLVLRSIERQRLDPERRAGVIRLFNREAFNVIVKDLKRIDEKHRRRRAELAAAQDEELVTSH
jgi:hypothetical protein